MYTIYCIGKCGVEYNIAALSRMVCVQRRERGLLKFPRRLSYVPDFPSDYTVASCWSISVHDVFISSLLPAVRLPSLPQPPPKGIQEALARETSKRALFIFVYALVLASLSGILVCHVDPRCVTTQSMVSRFQSFSRNFQGGPMHLVYKLVRFYGLSGVE